MSQAEPVASPQTTESERSSQEDRLRRAFDEARGLIELAIPVWATQLAILVAFVAAPGATFPFWPAVIFVVGSDGLILAFTLPALARFESASLLAAKWSPWDDFETELRNEYKLGTGEPLPPGAWFPVTWFRDIEGPVSSGRKATSWVQRTFGSIALRQAVAFSGMTAYFFVYGWFILSRCYGAHLVPGSWF